VPRAETYEQRAADCFKVVPETNDPAAKTILLEMAQAWLNLAKHKRGKDRQDHGSGD